MAQIIQKRILLPYIWPVSFILKRACSRNNDDSFTRPKFKIFKDESTIILDVEEERATRKLNLESQVQKEESEDFKRGLTGVFDIEELVSHLKKDNAKDIFVVQLPRELKYVDYLVVVTAKSKKHILGLAEYIRFIFKKKMNPSDIIPCIEGKDSPQWAAMDLGNIALHIMSHTARELYDLESLWSLGPQYDTKTNQDEDDIVELLKKHSISLDDLKPLVEQSAKTL